MKTQSHCTRPVAPAPEVPRWALDLVGAVTGRWTAGPNRCAVRVLDGPRFSLVSARIDGAALLDAPSFHRRTMDAYETIATLTGDRHPVRFWNSIPRILEPLGTLPHRYMVFNAGRFHAMKRRHRGPGDFGRCLATASGTGHGGDELEVHCLTAPEPGRAVENPRQVPSYRYSSRYGPLPPCFARATCIDGTPGGHPWLLVGGTASVRGEASMHRGDLARQLAETVANLGALAGAGAMLHGPAGATRAVARTLRVYHVGNEHRGVLADSIARQLPALDDVEFVAAQLCRPELLVEIEGVFELSPREPVNGAANGHANGRHGHGRS